MKELSIKRDQMDTFGSRLRRKFLRHSDSLSSPTDRVPKLLAASGLVKWGLRVVLLVGLLVLIDIYAPRFFRYQNLVNILLQASLLGLMTIGMTVVMIAGGIDLSNAMNLIGVSYYLSLIVKGAVIIAFIALEGRKENVNE